MQAVDNGTTAVDLKKRLNITKKPAKRDLHGVILLNKPISFSSNYALQQVKSALRLKKAGHTGSLDPLATGMLPLCLGSATKFAQYLLNADKTYQFVIRFGEKTTTADAEGDVVLKKDVPRLDIAILEKVCSTFIGDYSQVPPMHSALKHKGQPLYKLAREGIEIDRPARTVKIYDLSVKKDPSGNFLFSVRCSKGTYVRTLAEDIAERLGTCGYVQVLSRTGVGKLSGDMMLDMDVVLSPNANFHSFIRPVSILLEHLQSIKLSLMQIAHLKHGRTVRCCESTPIDVPLRLIDSCGICVGVGQSPEAGVLKAQKLIN